MLTRRVDLGQEHMNYSSGVPSALGSCGVPDWYVGQSPPSFGSAHKAVNACSVMGFKAWLPQIVAYRHTRKHGRAVWQNEKRLREETVQPLFPGYWFVSFDITAAGWGAILRDENVSRLLTHRGDFGSRPVKMPKGFVETMQSFGRAGDGALPFRLSQALEGKGWDRALAEELDAEEPRIKAGTLGTILDGAFTSFPAKVKMDMGDKIIVLASIFGRETPVELSPEQFEVVTA
jgi:transcription antitermination factor NusG